MKCPECGYELNGNENICPECGRNLKHESKESGLEITKNKSNLTKFLPIAIIAIIIIGAVILFTGGGGGDLSLTISETGGWQSTYDNNETDFAYNVNGYVSNVPRDTDKYFIKTTYYDANGTVLGKTTENFDTLHSTLSDSDLHLFSLLFSKQKLDIDHVTVQVVKDNKVLNEYNETFDKTNFEVY